MLVADPHVKVRPGIEDFENTPSGFDSLFGPSFPNHVYLIEYPGNLYALYFHKGDRGIACFSSEGRAIMYMDHLVGDVPPGSKVTKLTLDDALDKAKAKGDPIVGIFLLDNIDNPQIQYVV